MQQSSASVYTNRCAANALSAAVEENSVGMMGLHMYIYDSYPRVSERDECERELINGRLTSRVESPLSSSDVFRCLRTRSIT